MSYRLTFGLLLALLGLGACAGQSARPPGALSLQPLSSGLPTGGARLSHAADSLELSFPTLTADGAFVRLRLPEGQAVTASRWSHNAGLLQLVAPLPGGADVGVVPLPGYQPRPLTLTLHLASAPRAASRPPGGKRNQLIDLALEQGGAGQVRLSWTEVNSGDYDFNGEVNVADIIPISKLFQQAFDAPNPEQTVFWVDGDRNGEINASDLLPIGQAYGVTLAGYTVRRNGAGIPGENGQLPTIPRSAAQFRTEQQLPPRYTTVLAGSLLDEWSVVPVDSDGVPGTGGEVPPLPVDLRVRFSSTGLALYNQDGSGSGQEAAGHSRLRIVTVDDVMRIIDPGDDPSSAELGTSLAPTSGEAGFTGLPRGQWLLLQVALAPTVDPATGQPWPYPVNGDPPRYRCLHVPVKLPDGDIASQLTVSTKWIRQPGGGYQVLVSSELRAGALRLDTWSLLDYAAGLVSADTNADRSFDDELRLADPRRAGLSSQRLQQLQDDNDYAAGTRRLAKVSGRFGGLDEPAGRLTIPNAELILDGSPPAIPGHYVVELTEFVPIHEDLISPSGTLRREIAPAALRENDQLRVSGYMLDGVAGLPAKLWVTGITREVDTTMPDRLYAWPDRTSAYPGEHVTVTVSSEESANPFYALRGVRITWNNADYVPNSLNAGAPGGDRAQPDGIWAQVAATDLVLPSEGTLIPVPLAGERKALDFFVQPINGAQVELATGALLNFKLSILGNVTLGIQRADSSDMKRSYYSDQPGNEYYWADDFNNGVPQIEVIDPGGPKLPTDGTVRVTPVVEHTSDEAALAP